MVLGRYRKFTTIENHRVTADKFVVKLLYENKELRYSQIRKMLEENGMKYADHKGFDLVLERLQKKKIVTKIEKTKSRLHPVYVLTKKGFSDLNLNAEFFSDILIERLTESVDETSTKDNELFLKKIAEMTGLYIIYCYLQSWEFISSEDGRHEFYKIRQNWMEATLSSSNVMKLVHEGISRLFPKTPPKVIIEKNQIRVIDNDISYDSVDFDNFDFYDMKKVKDDVFSEQVQNFKNKIIQNLSDLNKTSFSEEAEFMESITDDLPYYTKNYSDIKSEIAFYKKHQKSS